VKTLVIDRSRWLRGEGADKSFLHRPEDGKQCCLGFYLRSCRVPLRELRGAAIPSDLETVPSQAAWLDDGHGRSEECQRLMTVNDAYDLPDAEREEKIRKTFAEHKVKVRFVGRRGSPASSQEGREKP